jgi:surfeit locus 1 family protein
MSKKSFIILTLASLISLAILIGLGTWQMKRLEWKEALLLERDQQQSLPLIDLPDTLDNPEDLNYRNVEIEGKFLKDKAVKLIPRVHEGESGANLIIPYERKDGSTFLIDLGWVPQGFDEQALDLDGSTLQGMARLPAERGSMQPDNQLSDRLLFWYDLEDIEKSLDIQNLQPLIIQRQKGGILDETLNAPIPHTEQIFIPNNHLQYAVTWYALAITLIGVYIFYIRRHMRLKPDEKKLRKKILGEL